MPASSDPVLGTPPPPKPRRESWREFGEDVERTYFCRSCQLVTRGLWMPIGWYALERAPGGKGRHLRLGLYCSLDCLFAARDLLAIGDKEYAARRGLPLDPGRDRKRLVETAETLLHQGVNVRLAALTLMVPTSSLRAWLREAGIDLVREPEQAESTGPGPAGPGRSPVSVVHELAQAGALSDLDWTPDSQGQPHASVFTCVVTVIEESSGGPITATGTGPSKTAAKTDAAARLLALL